MSTAMVSTGVVVGETAGRIAGGLLGGVLGSVFGPVGAWIGRAAGSRIGAMAGRAAAQALADYMAQANTDVETQTKDEAQAEPCKDCGEIDCFKAPEGADPAEFSRQLAEQQDKINSMDPNDLLENIERFDKFKRPKNDAADRRKAREEHRKERTSELEKQYQREGRSDFEEAAAADVAREMANLAATHTLDLVAGGDGSISGLGNRVINSSLGAQWKGKRAAQLKEHAEKAKEQGKKMNVKLVECPPDKNPGGKEAPQNGDGLGDPGLGVAAVSM